MKKATIRIRRDTQRTLKEMGERFVKAWKTGKSDGDLLQFESPAALFRVLTAKRWELIERLQTRSMRRLRFPPCMLDSVTLCEATGRI
jgi:hypothetical protein